MILDTHNRSLQLVLGEAHATRALDLTACFAQANAAGSFVTSLNQASSAGTTPVTIVGAPQIGVQYLVNEVRCHNNDTVTHTVVLQLKDGAATRIVYTGAVQAGGDFVYTPEVGAGGGAGAGGGSGVASWNTRIGSVTMTLGDVTGVGGAPLASPTFTGTVSAPTVSPPSDSSTQVATTAFVQSAIGAVSSGVTNIVAGSGLTGGGSGAVTLSVATNGISNALSAQMPAGTLKGNAGGATANATDLTASAAMTMLGAAPINNPTFTGTVTIPSGASIVGYAPLAGATFTGPITVPSLNNGQLAGFRNQIINGAFDSWQRGTSFSTPATGSYTADRWMFVYDGTGMTFTISRQSVMGVQVLNDAGFTNCLQYNCTVAGSGSTLRTLVQRIENVRTLSGRTVTISFYANAPGGAVSLPVNWAQNFGTGGSPSATVGGTAQNVSLTTTFARYSVTFALPTISGKTLGTNNDSFLSINLGVPLNATGVVNVTGVQVEPGSVATPFEWRPWQTEVALCQRYTTVIPALGAGSSATGASIILYAPFTFPVQMRALPTISVGSYSGIVNSSAQSIVATSNLSAYFSITATAAGQFTATANVITLSAEL